MTEYTPIPPEAATEGSPSRELTFNPGPVRPRHDGWTIERQIAFLPKLAGRSRFYLPAVAAPAFAEATFSGAIGWSNFRP